MTAEFCRRDSRLDFDYGPVRLAKLALDLLAA